MEFSEILGFFKILTESTKLLIKNGRFMAPISLISLLLPSILLLFFSFFSQFLTSNTINSITTSSDADSGRWFFLHIISYLVPLLSVEILVLFLYIAASQLLGIATVLTSVASYTDRKISLRELIHRTRRTWNSQRSNQFSRTTSKNPTHAAAFIGAMIVTPLLIFYPNPITISIAVVLLVTAFVIGIYSAVVTALANVILIVEEAERAEAAERGEMLVREQRQYGIMMNLFLNFVCLVVMAAGWVVLGGGSGDLNVTAFGLVCVVVLSAGKILGETMYTVFYFQCRKFHGEEDVDVLGSFEYSKLPDAADAKVGSDIA